MKGRTDYTSLSVYKTDGMSKKNGNDNGNSQLGAMLKRGHNQTETSLSKRNEAGISNTVIRCTAGASARLGVDEKR